MKKAKQKEKKKENRGGARPGAGRPKSTPKKAVKLTSEERELIAKLRTHPRLYELIKQIS